MERKKKTDDDVKTVVAPTKQSFAFEKYFGFRRKKKRGPKKKKNADQNQNNRRSKTTSKEQMLVNGGTLTQKKRAGLNAKLEACDSMPKTKR